VTPRGQAAGTAALVAAQAALMAALILTGPWWPAGSGCRVAAALAVGLGAWAVGTMGLRRLRVTPAPSADARLVTRGPFRWIRHPIYAVVLVYLAALVADAPTLLRAALWLGIGVVLWGKMGLEERLLEARFAEYAAYRKRTHRLIPGVL
jgi:protein-S-isoprenylcysteine O-methyltransferase Ste14